MSLRRAKVALLGWVAFTASCGTSAAPGGATPTPPAEERAPATTGTTTASADTAPFTWTSPEERAFLSTQPELLAELRGTPHRYFRFVNKRFAQRVCDLIDEIDSPGPLVNLHGDAHVEQYAVSAEERGLADFDAASTGPAMIDLVRFAVSLRLVAAQNGFPQQAKSLIDTFLDGYERALADPTTSTVEPRIAAALRDRFEASPRAWLEQTSKTMIDPSPSRRARLEQATRTYAGRMLRQNTSLPPTFFNLKKAGEIDIGVGSALEHKYLARVEGPSPSEDDDVILELKQMSDLRSVSCLAGAAGSDPFRVIAGQARMGAAPSELLGYVELDGSLFYVQKWRLNYTELRVADLLDAEKVAEIAYEVGLQLGRGHPRQIAPPHDVQMRAALQEHLQATRLMIFKGSADLEGEVVAAWSALRDTP